MKETRDFCIKYCNRKHYGEEDLYGEEVHLDWVSLLAYLGAKYGAVLGGVVGEYEREYPVSTEESEGSEAATEWKKV